MKYELLGMAIKFDCMEKNFTSSEKNREALTAAGTN
jgi:hypothetical protein